MLVQRAMNESEPTVLGRYITPITRGIRGFTFPVYRTVKRSKGNRTKQVFLTWKALKDCSLQLKEWNAFSFMPAYIKATAKPLLPNCIDITDQKLVRRIGREQQKLWTKAVTQGKRTPRPYDLKRKNQIKAKSKGMQRVSVPTCTPELVGVAKVRSEAAVIVGAGDRKGTLKLMALRDGAEFECSQDVIDHNDHEKARSDFARQYSNWTSQRSCSCKVSVVFII